MDLSPDLVKGLCAIISRRTSSIREVDRALLILELTKANPHQIAKRLNCNNEKAYRWYHRTEGLIEAFENEVGLTDPGIERLIRKFIKDKQRPGAPLFYTPKHCSWLNQIEMWLGILSRKILRYGSFKSTFELRSRIADFVEYYNQTMAKVFKWTYQRRLLQA